MAANILKEITSAKRFLKGRIAAAGSCDPSLLEGFTATLVRMISTSAVFGTAEGGLVQEALADSPYGKEGTTRIIAAIDSRIACAGTANECSKSARKSKPKNEELPKQTLTYWWHIFDMDELNFLQDERKSWSAKMTLAVERANKVGCVNPCEQSLKWLLAMLLVLQYEELPTYQQIYNKLQDLKQSFAAEKKMFDFEHVVEFPAEPSGLPKAVYDVAYPEGKPPVALVVHGVRTVASHIPLRKNSKLLKQGANKKPKLEPGDEPAISVSTAAGPVVQPVKAEAVEDSAKGELLAPEDPDERLLWQEYQARRAELRQARADRMVVPTAHAMPQTPAASPQHGITLQRSGDGSLRLAPRSLGAAALKAEDAAPAPAPASAAPTYEDLDPYAKEALKALHKRAAKTKEKTKAKAKAKAGKLKAEKKTKAEAGSDDDDDDDDDDGSDRDGGEDLTIDKPPAVKKRPAAGMKGRPRKVAAKAKAAATAKHESKVKAVKAEGSKEAPTAMKATKKRTRGADVTEVSKALILKSMPKMPADGSNPLPVHYNGGVIYTSRSIQKFRALRKRGDKYSEKGAGWSPHSHGTQAKAWKVAVASIDEYQAKLAKK